LAIPISWELLTRLRDDGLERERLKGEMQAARLVQQLFLSTRPAHIDVVYEPAHEVGGDFAFVFPQDDGGHLIAAGDVSGKGLKAAMIVSVIAGALRNRRANEPAELLAELNRALAGGPDHGFVTAIIVRCTPRGELQLASAGNPPPYLAGCELEMAAGLRLGISLDASYATQTAALQEGEQLTLVSDGVVEAENAQRELFGFDRTRAISTKPAQEIAAAAQAWGQNDDITVVTVRRNA
jgi:sigma-B regulation protein RsbU (phosphoserine phosphatase)